MSKLREIILILVAGNPLPQRYKDLGIRGYERHQLGTLRFGEQRLRLRRNSAVSTTVIGALAMPFYYTQFA
jgi:hypothetical protein